MPFRRHSALFFLPFLKISEVPNRHQRPFLPGVNMEKGFTSQSDGLATTQMLDLTEPTKGKGRKTRIRQPNQLPTTQTINTMYLETDCTSIDIKRWNELMKGARKASYPRLVRRIKKELPKLYATLSLDVYNPWCGRCQQTRTHYILVHSAIEYFIRK